MGVRTDMPDTSYGYQYQTRALKVGMILLFNLAIAKIPEHWALCDGSLGTPDLRDKFIVGAGDTYDPGDTGGDVDHQHDFTSDIHYHQLVSGTDIVENEDFSPLLDGAVATGTTDNGNVLPPYHGIVFIKKIEEGGP